MTRMVIQVSKIYLSIMSKWLHGKGPHFSEEMKVFGV